MDVRVVNEGSDGKASSVVRVTRGGKVMAVEVRRKKLVKGGCEK